MSASAASRGRRRRSRAPAPGVVGPRETRPLGAPREWRGERRRGAPAGRPRRGRRGLGAAGQGAALRPVAGGCPPTGPGGGADGTPTRPECGGPSSEPAVDWLRPGPETCGGAGISTYFSGNGQLSLTFGRHCRSQHPIEPLQSKDRFHGQCLSPGLRRRVRPPGDGGRPVAGRKSAGPPAGRAARGRPVRGQAGHRRPGPHGRAGAGLPARPGPLPDRGRARAWPRR